MDDLFYDCKYCGKEMIISKDARGDLIKCPSCKEEQIVTEDDSY